MKLKLVVFIRLSHINIKYAHIPKNIDNIQSLLTLCIISSLRDNIKVHLYVIEGSPLKAYFTSVLKCVPFYAICSDADIAMKEHKHKHNVLVVVVLLVGIGGVVGGYWCWWCL